ncbi:Uma2 family endonuclease [Gloeobacter violaceus]|uniref:Gll2990 protein n=1 Tax=Gloeobacter violaceus (strain ATCC 29082 / PCC 7421) TaxID=251221 RepID=Q7NCI9_GLOVI|nr:Uma2 family endonuclease [Gloeobacter violaceus]BAC90931.1 gll2990 [Gloeobacter violaceus PCC 7421]
MIQTAASEPSGKTMTFEEYVRYQGEPGIRYELFHGHLEPITTPTGLHTSICEFVASRLQRQFAAQQLPLVAKSAVGVRTEEDTSRIPDVVVCSRELWERLCARPGDGILDTGETPLLVVEVVSEDWRRDYVRKRAEYAMVDIPEYWIVDPVRQRVWVLSDPQSENSYERVEFQSGDQLVSVQFPQLELTVDILLSPPLVEDVIREEQTQLQRARQETEQAMQEAAQAKQQAERERQRSERLAAYLREQGVDPEAL